MGMISYVEELDRKCLLMYNTPTDFLLQVLLLY